MTTTQSTRPQVTIPRLSAKDEAARSALIASFDHGDETRYAEQDAALATFDNASRARACRRIAAKLTWMILDDQDTEGTYPAKIADLTAMAEWLEAQL